MLTVPHRPHGSESDVSHMTDEMIRFGQADASYFSQDVSHRVNCRNHTTSNCICRSHGDELLRRFNQNALWIVL